MPKFMSAHSMPPGAVTREQVDQMAESALHDGTVKPYQSFLNLAEGKMICAMEAPTKEALSAWFGKMQLTCDYITPVEIEGDHGHLS
ncbi:MAG TPA: DUF4242 domain-containing protein [Candidatus Hydrogenedentes bacterium]|nr:DUF4242 domain-containing protein [Candidatus Hydrogenedentota bacterium]HRK34748.1 DUF4242 domain-containing protein [Candidatus Hydrogenedentota bacterium]